MFSLTGHGNGRRWTEEFPPTPTRRWGSIALCTGTALIVAGGWSKDYSELKTVEVMNTTTKQWSTAADLPQPITCHQAAVCGDQIYILGEHYIYMYMYTCSVLTLIQSCKSFLASIRNRGARVWKEAAAPPVTLTTCVSIHDQLLTIGGRRNPPQPFTCTTQRLTPGRSLATWGYHEGTILQLSSLTTK